MTVQVKICGIKLLEDALVVEEAGADMIGFVFAPSPRRVLPEEAAGIRRRVPGLAAVGVFVDEDPEIINRIGEQVGLDMVQLHGNEPLSHRDRIGLPVIRSLAVDRPLRPEDPALKGWDFILLDAAFRGKSGGTGKTFPWSHACALAGLEHPRIFLAGGLRPENVMEAVERLRPWAVDCSTGVESEPGKKDGAKVRSFVKNAKGALL